MIYPLFVYGTLLQGQPNHHLLSGRIDRISPGWIEGAELYSLGSYPMLVEGHGRVVGELVYLPDATEAYFAILDLLDRLEGVDDEDGLYRRVLMQVCTASGEQTPAWVYAGHRESVLGRKQVEGGDWAAYVSKG